MLGFTLLLLAGAQSVFAKCKCTPTDPCWPSLSAWSALNTSVDGKLIHTQPIAEPCYPGADYSNQLCQYISDEWNNSSFIELNPAGYCYPRVETCPPVNITAGNHTQCTLGTAPVYTINATEAEDVAAGIKFAQDNNVRLVIKNTGHDIVGRSQGYGALMVWIKYIQSGVTFQETYAPSNGCQSNWTGSAFTVGGGYIWDDLYTTAASHDRIVVGGDDPTVGVIGGYLQGGGHSPSGHYFGLATDQVLELTVVLASGETVTANACQNTDLFTALRGGGGGTYGVVISATIKAHPAHQFIGHRLYVIPQTANLSTLLNISANIVSKYSILSDAGFSGYAEILPSSELSLSIPAGAIYMHSFGVMIPSSNASATIQHAKSVLNSEILADLLPYNGSDFLIESTWYNFPSFESYYDTIAGGSSAEPTGVSDLLLSSRMFDKPSLLNNADNLEGMLHTIFSKYDGGPLNATDIVIYLCLIGGGQVLHPTPYTSVNPAWRKTYLLTEIIVGWPEDASAQTVNHTINDLTFRKSNAMKALTPGMGSYVNEADGYDPSWKEDFFGPNYDWLLSVKRKYDPDDVFYCWRCVGSESWAEVTGGRGYGPLCQTS
ncbi:FAD-binding domain-containing protein [Aspergillus heteromorphus CBS 117.55]|uniref:FAD-binding domain-containing protein n=1 Tax=Aspergillus heteromorphus CBS 117.55 TaxID=1448321 RepID=A0A317W7D1_9EURO|nr:FAD-binding domain-containing protein [Aspergillus heteromorphus CBS 117.55]PWY81989.1 FAD-binding domain-containing protein [Aspergillus heteromorphus CBS 117.55]